MSWYVPISLSSMRVWSYRGDPTIVDLAPRDFEDQHLAHSQDFARRGPLRADPLRADRLDRSSGLKESTGKRSANASPALSERPSRLAKGTGALCFFPPYFHPLTVIPPSVSFFGMP